MHNISVILVVVLVLVLVLVNLHVLDVILISERVINISLRSKHHLHGVMESCVQNPCNGNFGERVAGEPIPKDCIPVPENIEIVNGPIICWAKPSGQGIKEGISVENRLA